MGNYWSFWWRFEIEFLPVGLFCNLRNQSLCILLMAEDGLRTGGFSSDLAVILNGGATDVNSCMCTLQDFVLFFFGLPGCSNII